MGSIEHDLRRYEAEQHAKDRAHDAAQPDIERTAEQLAQESITDADWWQEVLYGDNPITKSMPLVFADVFKNLDAACGGDALSNQAILSALVRLQRVAYLEALDEATDTAECEELKREEAAAINAATQGEGEL